MKIKETCSVSIVFKAVWNITPWSRCGNENATKLKGSTMVLHVRYKSLYIS